MVHPWHALKTDEVVKILDTNLYSGLHDKEVKKRIKKYGLNQTNQHKETSPIIQFLSQLHQPLIYILNISGTISLIFKEYTDAAVIFGVVFIAAIVGFIQEYKASNAIKLLSKLIKTHTNIIRSNTLKEIDAVDLVPGDIVIFKTGDKVPADIRIIESQNLKVDESTLTGESVSVEKKSDTIPKNTLLPERKNILYTSTLITQGMGKGIVVVTGNQTEMGHISKLMHETQNLDTPLSQKIAQFSRWLLYIILVFTVLMGCLMYIQSFSLKDIFKFTIAFSVASIPEGLPAAYTIILAIGISRMAKKKAIIRRFPSVETLGNTTIICSDKTGTLTKNEMTVQQIYAGSQVYKVTGVGYNPNGEILGHYSQNLIECLKAGILCNDSLLYEKNKTWNIKGDPTDGALLVSGKKANLSKNKLNTEYPRIDVLPFASEYQYMATLHKGKEKNTLYLKGAPEVIIQKCHDMLNDKSQVSPLDKSKIFDQIHQMAKSGLRILAFAKMQTDKNEIIHQDLNNHLTFIGLQAMEDPPRPNTIEAIKSCHSAGIKVKMITGDHAITAESIAKKIGFGNNIHVLTGAKLDTLKKDEIINIVEKVDVFARVTTEQKLVLVKALQKKGHIVAMTGDGVNDAPALKRADIGICMGKSGTDVAKDAAEMVIMDDNFSTIESAVEEGRCIFSNLTKFIVWTLPTNLGEGLVILAAIFLSTELPILPVQILWINMTTAIFLGLMLVFEPKERDIMNDPPKNPDEPILNAMLIERIILMGILLLITTFYLFNQVLNKSDSILKARTVAVNMFIFGEIFYLFNCRSLKKSAVYNSFFSNKSLFIGVTCMIVLQIFYTYHPIMHNLFHSAPIDLSHWIQIILLGISIFIIVEIRKWLKIKENTT